MNFVKARDSGGKSQTTIAEIHYSIAPGCSLVVDPLPVGSTPERGRIALDGSLLELCRLADGRSLDAILKSFCSADRTDRTVRAALACLAEAGLLTRGGEAPTRAAEPRHGPLVSAVIVSFNGRDWLRDLLPTLVAQTYSPLELIVVDNGSTDDTLAWLSDAFPAVRALALGASHSFAHAVNRGVETASGEYLLLLNQDICLEPDTLSKLVHAAEADTACAAVASKLKFLWAPAFLNGLGNSVQEHSWGSDNAIGHLDLGQFDEWRDVPSACFAAALVSRSAWNSVGVLDEGFPMYYEDAEWCYRARALGYRICVAPQAIAYHAFGGKVPSGKEEELPAAKLHRAAYGRLRFAFKLLRGRWLRRFIVNYIREDFANARRAVANRDVATFFAYLGAWGDLVASFADIHRQRHALERRMVCTSEALLATRAAAPGPLIRNGLPLLTWDLVQTCYLPLIAKGRTRPMPEFDGGRPRPQLLIVSNDVVDTKMAGPGMRYLEMARVLAESIDVVLAVPADTSLEEKAFHLVRYWEDRPGTVQVLMENCDVALISGYMVEKFPFLDSVETPLVVDLYDPFVLENLYYYSHQPLEEQNTLNEKAVEVTNLLAKLGDFFICGNERQRDFWLGLLAANGRITPKAFKDDQTLRALIDVVGIGLPRREPVQRAFLAGVDPRVPKDARIVLWGGGIWNWLDPLTLIRAWPEVLRRCPDARLVLLGTRHPNPAVPVHEMARQAESLASELGEKDRSIIFLEWVGYDDREALLTEASVGVTLHPVHAETRYSMRTRVLDYLWARLPVVMTEGDTTSKWISGYGVGRVVPPDDPDAVAQALVEVLSTPKEEYAPRFDPIHELLAWPTVVTPLRDYCFSRGRSSDRKPPDPESLRNRVLRIVYEEGTGALFRKGWRAFRRRLSRVKPQ